MSLQLIIGPMFSGKSSEILGIARKYQAIGWPVLVITHSIDKRYTDISEVVSHNNERFPAISLENLQDALKLEAFERAKLVIIEEAQFFVGLQEFTLNCVETLGKNVVCVGLDGDIKREPFGEILRLIPYCDSVVKRSAFCRRCSIPTQALFTYRKEESISQIIVGGSELYEPLCRQHYLSLNNNLYFNDKS